MKIRLPAEWEAQDGVMLAWPHEATDWCDMLDEVRPVFCEIIRQISRFEKVLLVAPSIASAESHLKDAGIDVSGVTFCQIPTNDTWARDFGPIAVMIENRPVIMDFGFNGWGLKFPSCHDNRITRELKRQGVFKAHVNTIGLVLEGGSIESDGLGTILTTSACLLEANRNPQLSRREIEDALSSLLGAMRVLWLDHGFLAGDDTDSHIDTLARICPGNTILYTACDDVRDEHYGPLKLMEKQLQSFTAPDGSPYTLVPLPWPSPKYDDMGHRLPATYANFLIINGAVLVPTYRDKKDGDALAAVAAACPGREVIAVDCLPLVRQHGSLHCVTMQLPKGVL